MKTMKSKSFDLKRSSSQSGKLSKTFDFVGLYKSAAEDNGTISLEKPKTAVNLDKENNSIDNIRKRTPQSKKKKLRNEPLDISHIYIDGQNFNIPGKSSPVHVSRATSTPNVSRKAGKKEPTVKSIMKTSQRNAEDTMDSSVAETSVSKPKKRNKSVSFMLDDNEEIAIKKTKSNDSLSVSSKVDKIKSVKQEKMKLKKLKKHRSEKENNDAASLDINQPSETCNKKIKSKVNKTISDTSPEPSSDTPNTVTDKKKKVRKIKKRKKVEEGCEASENDSNNNEEQNQEKTKKIKKKKLSKTGNSNETSDGEPAKKLKKEVKPEVIAEDLENLSIGDNAHTLTNLLDEMMVVDKDKKKRNKLLRKKPKHTASVSSSETADLEKIDEEKEKVKWKKRKWNKDKKGDMDEQIISNSIIIDNLPLKIMCNYKKLLAEHFSQFGLIKKVGIAEMYPTEEPKPVFTTTIMFYSDGAATKALEEDNTLFEGSRIRVKRPLPPTETTVVVRSYADLTEQNLSSVFTSAGRIRSMRHLVKGKKFMSTSFIEFDGPEAVQRAIKMAEDAKIGGKKIHVSKFEHRSSKRKIQKTQPGSENEGDSEDSND